MPANQHQLNQLVDAFMYYVQPDVRSKIMKEVPAAYNAYVERDVVQVVRTTDGTPI